MGDNCGFAVRLRGVVIKKPAASKGSSYETLPGGGQAVQTTKDAVTDQYRDESGLTITRKKNPFVLHALSSERRHMYELSTMLIK